MLFGIRRGERQTAGCSKYKGSYSSVKSRVVLFLGFANIHIESCSVLNL